VATHGQHKLLNGILIPDLMESLGIEYTKEKALIIKEAFKTYLDTASTSDLPERVMAIWTEAFKMLCSREFGVEVPLEDANKSMKQLLKEI